jgi:hypothetical protein
MKKIVFNIIIWLDLVVEKDKIFFVKKLRIYNVCIKVLNISF